MPLPLRRPVSGRIFSTNLVVVDLVEGRPHVDGFSNLAPTTVLESFNSAVLDGAALYLCPGHRVTEVHAFRPEVPDVEVKHLQAGDRGRYFHAILVQITFPIRPKNVNGGGDVSISSVITVEAEVFDGVVVVGNLQHSVLSVTTFDASAIFTLDGDTGILSTVGYGKPIVKVVTRLEDAGVAGLYFLQANCLKVIVGRNSDGHGRQTSNTLRERTEET